MNLFEIGILDLIQKLRTPFGDAVMPVVTVLGNGGIFWILMTLALLLIPKPRRLGLVCAVSLLIDVALCNGLIKNLVARTRPYVVNPDIVLLIEKPGEFSFPSGHTCCAFAAGMVWLRTLPEKWMAALAALLAVCMGLSRLYVGVHFPSDVLCGTLVGYLCGFLGWKIALYMEEKRRKAPL